MSNISIIVVAVLALLLTIALLVVGLRILRRSAANREVRHVDLSAFGTLFDRDDEEFFREKLTRSESSHLKRLRIRVTWKYVRRIADNAAVVMRDETSDGQTADLAAQIRVQCVVAFAKLAVEFAFPSVQLTPAVLASKYESLRQNLSRLGSPLVGAM